MLYYSTSPIRFLRRFAGVAELADAPDLGSGGRPWGFESLHPHSKTDGPMAPSDFYALCYVPALFIFVCSQLFPTQLQHSASVNE